VAAQALHDLDALRDRRPEVLRAADRVALVEVVRPHAHLHETVAERLDRRHVVVDAAQQHRLIVERNAGAQEPIARARRFGRALARMVEVHVHPHRVVLRQHVAQLVVDALRQRDGHARSDADDLEVRDRAQLREDRLELRRGVVQRVAARHDHVAHLRRSRDVVDHAVDLDVGRRALVHRPLARAVAAVDRAVVRDHHQHAVGIAVRDPGHRRVALLAERILVADRAEEVLLGERHDLAQDRILRIVRVDEREVVGRDAHPEVAQDLQAVRPFVRGDLEVSREFLEGRDAVPELPAPVVPLRVGGVGKVGGAPGARALNE
jgi:hypothetical protein